MILRANYILALVFSFFLFQCGKETIEEPKDPGYSYFPFQLNNVWTYQVDSVVYDPFGSIGTKVVTSNFEKNLVKDYFILDQDTMIRVEQLISASQKGPFTFSRNIFIKKNRSGIFFTENNFTFLRCIFPFITGSKWEGNALINENTEIQIAGEKMQPFKGWIPYRVSKKVAKDSVLQLTFDNVITINETQSENIIEYRKSFVKYANQIGEIYREMWILDSQCGGNPADCLGKTWEEKAEKGYILKKYLLDYQIFP